MAAKTYPFQDLSLVERPEEVWKDIPGADGLYQISNQGRARRLAHQFTNAVGATTVLPAIMICQQATSRRKAIHPEGKMRFHLSFSITVGGHRRKLNTSRMVYYLFVQPFDLNSKDKVVLYRDDNPLNVTAENLYLGTLKEKARLASNRHAQGEPVSQYTRDGRRVRTFPNCAEAARALGLSPSTVQHAAKGRKRLTAGGFVWRRGDAERVEVNLPRPVSKPKSKPRRVSSPVSSGHGSAPKKVSQYNFDGILVRSYDSVSEASRKTALARSTIQRVLRGDFTSAGGYLWSYGESLRLDLRELRRRPNIESSAFGRYLMEKRLKNLEKLAVRRPTGGNPDFEKGKLAVVRNLILDFGFTDEQISRAAELPIEQIRLFREQVLDGTG